MRKTRILSLAMCFVMLLSCVPSFALASGTPLLGDSFTVEGMTSMEGKSIKDWNGWDITANSTKGTTKYTIEKDIDDKDKSFDAANKVVKIEKLAQADAGQFCGIKKFENAYTGKVRVSFILDGRNATTTSGDIPITIWLGNGTYDEYGDKGLLGQLNISGSDISSYEYFYDETNSKDSSKANTVSTHVYGKLKIVFEIDTALNTYSTYVYRADGNLMASFVNKTLLKPSNNKVEIQTIRFYVNRTTAVNAYWTVDDIKVEQYNDDVDESYLADNANWELSEKDDFQSIESTTYETYKNNQNGWNNYFKNGWNNWSLVSGSVNTAITENHTQFNIIKDPNAEEGKWDQANKYMQMKHFTYTTEPGQNLSFRKKLSKAYSGRYKIKFNLNSKDDDYGSGHIPFKVFFNDKDAIDQYMDNKYIFVFGITNENAYVDGTSDSKFIGRKTGWFPVEFDIDTANSRYDLYINGDKTTGFSGNKDTIFYPKNSAGETSVEYLTFNMGDRKINGEASWYVDDIEIWTPKYWQVAEEDDVTENLYTNEKNVSDYDNAWSSTGNARVSLADETNTALKLINAATVSKDFTATEGVITATAKLRTADVTGKENKAGAISMLLRDSDGSPLTKIDISSYNFAYSSDKFTDSLGDSSQNLVVDEALYAADEWFTLKVEANTDKRTYDVYVNSYKTGNADKKIGANLPFYNTVTPSNDNGEAAQLAFITKDGRTWFVDDVAVEQTAEPEVGIYAMSYQDGEGNAVLSPVDGGKVSNVKVRVPSSGTPEVFVAVYDKDGNIFDVGTNSTPIAVDGGLYNVDVDVSFPERDANLCDVRIFFWDGVTLRPLSDTVSLNEPENVTVYIAAASLSESYDVYKYPTMGWGDALRHYVDMEKVTIDNRAMGGRSTKTFIDEGRLDKIGETIKKGDYLLVSFCHNDSAADKIDSYVPLESTGTVGEADYVKGYKEYVQEYIDFAESHQANIIWVAPAARSNGFDDEGAIEVTGTSNADLKDYTDAAKEICDYNGVPYIDVFNYTLDKKNINSTNYTQWYSLMSANDTERYAGDLLFAASKYGTVAGSNSDDTTHLQAYGAQMIAKYIADFIKNGTDKNGNPWNFSIRDSIDLTSFTPVAK